MAADQDNPPGDKVGGDIDGSSDKTITDLLLGVVNWWCMKSGKTEVVNLVMRHFEHEEVYNSSLILSDFLGLDKPAKHNNSSGRPALDPCTNYMVKIMKDLVDSKQVPQIVIPASQLGRVPLDALSISAERSVGARLESLEVSVQSIVSAVEKLAAVKAPALLPGVAITPASALAASGPAAEKSFANIASRLLPPGHGGQVGQGAQAAHGGRGGPGGGHHGQSGQGGRDNRDRSRSPQVKRDHDGAVVDEDGFRRPGRARHQNRPVAAGASKVVVEDVGELQPSLQYFLGNTPGKASDDVIKKVLQRCATPLLEDDSRGPLVIESVHCLTKDPDPRTR